MGDRDGGLDACSRFLDHCAGEKTSGLSLSTMPLSSSSSEKDVVDGWRCLYMVMVVVRGRVGQPGVGAEWEPRGEHHSAFNYARCLQPLPVATHQSTASSRRRRRRRRRVRIFTCNDELNGSQPSRRPRTKKKLNSRTRMPLLLAKNWKISSTIPLNYTRMRRGRVA